MNLNAKSVHVFGFVLLIASTVASFVDGESLSKKRETDATVLHPPSTIRDSQLPDTKSDEEKGSETNRRRGYASAESTSQAGVEGASRKISLAITISGGVSLGAYQAGYLYYLTETAKRNPTLFDFRLVTGASAGMINAMLTLLSMGREDGAVLDPTESLFYKIWTEMRYRELLDIENAPPGALSSKRLLNQLADVIESEWNKGLKADFDMVFGASATRFEGRNVEISDSLHVKTLEEKFAFRVRGRGRGIRSAVTNYVDTHFGLQQALLPFAPPDGLSLKRSSDFSVIRQIMFASSAIPVVFQPQEVAYCLTQPGGVGDKKRREDTSCRDPDREDYFVDGGIVDRKPLRLAHRIARSGLVLSDRGFPEWRDEPDMERGTLPENVFFLYVDPRTPSYPTPVADDADEFFAESAKVFKTAGQFFKGIFRSVQSKELYTLVEEHPEIRQRIQLATHNFPTMGGQMANFFGFFDRKIRKFDFYLGMLDARRFLETVVTDRMRKLFQDDAILIALPETQFEMRSSADTDTGWRPYFCLRSAVDGQKRYDAACRTSSLYDFRILAQATLDRLYDLCRNAEGDAGKDNPHCQAAAAGKTPPHVWGVRSAPKDAWKRPDDDSENSFEYTMRLLEMYDFHFKDLGLERGDADLAMSRIREELLSYVDRFAKKLRYGEAMAVRILGKPAINFFAYAPPAGIVYLVAGTGAELAFSATLGKSNWLRFNFALEFEGFNLFLTNKPNAFALTPAIGLELELYPLSSPLLQTRLGARIGYQFSTEDQFLTGTCDASWFQNDPIRCSAPVTQFFVAFVLYERIRLQLGVEWYPKWLPPMNTFDEHLFSGMVEVGWQWISPF